MSAPNEPKAIQHRSTFRLSTSIAIRVRASLAKVWELLEKPESWPVWNSTVTSAEGRVSPGAVIKLKVPIAPDREFKLKVLEVEPQRRMVWADGSAPMFRGVRTYTLTPADDGSITFEMTEVMKGLMLPMIAGSLPDFGPVFETFAADLKRAAED